MRGLRARACTPRGLADQLGQHDDGRLCGPSRSAAGRPAARRRRRAARGSGRCPAPRRRSHLPWPRRVAKNRVVWAAPGPRAISGGSAATSALIRCLLDLEVASPAQLAGQPAQLDDEVVGAVRSSSARNDWKVLRIRRQATRMACTPSGTSRRTCGSEARIASACSVQVGEHDLAGGRLPGRPRAAAARAGAGRRARGPASTPTPSAAPRPAAAPPRSGRAPRGCRARPARPRSRPTRAASVLTAGAAASTPCRGGGPVTRSSVTVATAAPRVVGQRPLLADRVELDDRLQRRVPVGGAAERDQRGGGLR